MSTTLLPLFYFGPASWFIELLKAEAPTLEIHDQFPRRTNRHRCLILGANGPIQLSIHLQKWHSGTTRTNELLLSYTEAWQKDHWNSIRSAYGRSAYFEHYEHLFEALFAQQPKTLVEWNLSCLKLCCELLGIAPLAATTADYSPKPTESTDLRRAFQSLPPNIEQLTSETYHGPKYMQVFGDRFEFVPHLSVLDLLFNEGPNALYLLQSAIKK